jgi:hypothetical protein
VLTVYFAHSPPAPVLRRPINEAETCHSYVEPALRAAGWEVAPCAVVPQHYFTDGRVSLDGTAPHRLRRKYADYLLRLTPDVPLAVVEAKRRHRHAHDGLQQAIEYGEILGVPFAFATNGRQIVEHDFLTGQERGLPDLTFPAPDDLWRRYCVHHGLDDRTATLLLAPGHYTPGRAPRYYQEAAVLEALRRIAQGAPRVLLTLATGTGKTLVAFQLCWRLGRPAGPGAAPTASRASSFSPTATSSSPTRTPKTSSPSATPAPGLAVRRSPKAARSTSPPTRRSPSPTLTARRFSAPSRRTPTTSCSWTSATAAAPATPPPGATCSPTSAAPCRWA